MEASKSSAESIRLDNSATEPVMEKAINLMVINNTATVSDA